LRLALLPVVRVLLVDDPLRVAGARANRVGTTADRGLVRVLHRVGDLGPDVLRHDRRLAGDVVEVGGRRGLELEDDLVSLAAYALKHGPHGLEIEGLVLLDKLESEEGVSRSM